MGGGEDGGGSGRWAELHSCLSCVQLHPSLLLYSRCCSVHILFDTKKRCASILTGRSERSWVPRAGATCWCRQYGVVHVRSNRLPLLVILQLCMQYHAAQALSRLMFVAPYTCTQ